MYLAAKMSLIHISSSPMILLKINYQIVIFDGKGYYIEFSKNQELLVKVVALNKTPKIF